MSAKPSWQDTLPPPGTRRPDAAPAQTLSPQAFRLIQAWNVIMTVVIAAWLLWFMQGDAATRWLLVGLVLASGAFSFFFLRHLARRHAG